MSFINIRAVIYLLLIVLGLSSAVPNFLSERAQSTLPTWFTHNTLKLGLDLQGGSHLLLTADTAPLIKAAITTISEHISSQLKENSIAYRGPITDGTRWQINLRDPAQLVTAKSLAMQQVNASDGQRMFKISSTENTLNFTLTEEYVTAITSDALERSLEVVRRP